AGFRQDEERTLFDRISEVAAEADDAVKREDFTAAMTAMARLRAPVDAFFDKVTVNAEDAKLRINRLALLSQIRSTLETVADFSKIA
ncbi:MAG: DALR anticodon-binding domain-containing protein, partial [Alphaproteobacteria bacterium]